MSNEQRSSMIHYCPSTPSPTDEPHLIPTENDIDDCLSLLDGIDMSKFPPGFFDDVTLEETPDVTIEETSDVKINGFYDAAFEMLRDTDRLFDSHMENSNQENHTMTSEQLAKGSTGTENKLPDKNIEQAMKKSSSMIKRHNFIDSNINELIPIGPLMTMSVAPYPYQRARYENECEPIPRYIFVPNNESMTIAIPDLRNGLASGVTVWMRITRITAPHVDNGLVLIHPYPIWIKNNQAKVHNESLFLPVTDQNMKEQSIKINNLVMIRLKQCNITAMKTLTIYDQTQLNLTELHPIRTKNVKKTIKEYDLRHYSLVFQLVFVDQNNVASLSDCCCHTELIREYEAKDIPELRHVLAVHSSENRQRRKTIGKQTKTRAANLKRLQGAASQCRKR